MILFTLARHLKQSAHLYSSLKISMACWMIAREDCTRGRSLPRGRHGVPVVTGGGPFEIAVAQNELPVLPGSVRKFGAARIECGEGFTHSSR